jgi:peptide/nickel transport system substrate-binding protein
VALAALASACSRAGAPVSNASLAVALPIAPNNLNPILSTNSSEAFVDDLMFAKLVTMDDRHAQIPDLAATVPTTTNGGISRDGLTIVYHLRHDAVWSDGIPVTSADVKYSFEQVMNPANNVISRHGFDEIRSVDTPDKWTVVVHMKALFPPLVDAFFGESDEPYDILPEHVLAGRPDLNTVAFNSDPTVTDGPYRFVRWLRGDHIELAANDRYFRGAPAIKALDVKILTDTNTVTAQLRTGETKLGLELTGPSYRNLMNDPRVTRLAVTAPVYDSLLMNCGRSVLSDRHLRVALAYATDRATITRDNEFGEAIPGAGDLSPFSWAYDPSVHAQPYDPAKARALLDADGWKIGPGGVRVKNGKKLALLLVYGSGSDIARNIVVQLQQMWRGVGAEVQPKSFPYAQLYAPQQNGGIYASGKYDVGFYAWVSGRDPDDSSQFLSTAIPPAGNNFSFYRSTQMDALQREALSTFDVARRKKAYAKIQQLIVDDVPQLILFYRQQLYAHAPALGNFLPNGVGEAWNAQSWTLTSPEHS